MKGENKQCIIINKIQMKIGHGSFWARRRTNGRTKKEGKRKAMTTSIDPSISFLASTDIDKIPTMNLRPSMISSIGEMGRWKLFLVLCSFASLVSIEGFAPIRLHQQSSNLSQLGVKTEQKQHLVPNEQNYSNILILDHLNINHEKLQHDQLKAFYFSVLQCAIDPRKQENIEKGRKTLWANIGAQQFHLPEGKPDAQVLKGEITLGYSKDGFNKLLETYETNTEIRDILKGTEFHLKVLSDTEILVTDPWGSKFRIIASETIIKDPRGVQNGESSLGASMEDLTFYTPHDANIEGIARFYEQILDAPILECDEERCVVSVGPYQTLTFQAAKSDQFDSNMHVDLRDEPENNVPEQTYYMSNYGPHISIYVRDITATYRRAEKLGVTYVNPRFSRKAYSEEEVIRDCMFRCLDIVDPEDPEDGAILRLEHEVRSVLKGDGGKYKSCPFDDVPAGCAIS